MRVERKDVFEFLVTLDESEFAEMKCKADRDGETIEDYLLSMIEYATDVKD